MNENAPEITRMTLRVNPERRRVLELLKAVTHQRTASKALWRAAEELLTVKAIHDQITHEHRGLLEAGHRVKTAEAEAAAAVERLDVARRELDDTLQALLD